MKNEVVWKFVVKLKAERQMVTMPAVAKIVYFGLDGSGDPCLWAIVDPDMPTEGRSFVVRGTGRHWTAAERGEYVGTLVQGVYVWHCFEVTPL